MRDWVKFAEISVLGFEVERRISTREIKVCFVDSRCLASQVTIGIASLTDIRIPDVISVMPLDAVKAVAEPKCTADHGFRRSPPLESSLRGVVCPREPQHNSSVNKFVPHEPESMLSRRAKSIKDESPGLSDTRLEVSSLLSWLTLLGAAARPPPPTLACVITASVVSGTISDTEPTNVVLPTPNPPATTTLAEMRGPGGGSVAVVALRPSSVGAVSH